MLPCVATAIQQPVVSWHFKKMYVKMVYNNYDAVAYTKDHLWCQEIPIRARDCILVRCGQPLHQTSPIPHSDILSTNLNPTASQCV